VSALSTQKWQEICSTKSDFSISLRRSVSHRFRTILPCGIWIF